MAQKYRKPKYCKGGKRKMEGGGLSEMNTDVLSGVSSGLNAVANIPQVVDTFKDPMATKGQKAGAVINTAGDAAGAIPVIGGAVKAGLKMIGGITSMLGKKPMGPKAPETFASHNQVFGRAKDGMKLPVSSIVLEGGGLSPVLHAKNSPEGYTAAKYGGRSHKKGGVKLNNAEVEGGEYQIKTPNLPDSEYILTTKKGLANSFGKTAETLSHDFSKASKNTIPFVFDHYIKKNDEHLAKIGTPELTSDYEEMKGGGRLRRNIMPPMFRHPKGKLSKYLYRR